MNRPRLIARVCEACGQPFEARASDSRPNRGRTCSPRCAGRLGGRPKGAHPPKKGAHPFQKPEHTEPGA